MIVSDMHRQLLVTQPFPLAHPILTGKFMSDLSFLRDYADILAESACQYEYTLSVHPSVYQNATKNNSIGLVSERLNVFVY